MHGQERILRERFAQVTCAACGLRHRPDVMLVLAQRESRWLGLLTCWQCQRRSIFVASFPRSAGSLDALDALDPLDPSRLPPVTHPRLPALSSRWSIQHVPPQAGDLPNLIHPHPSESADTFNSSDPLSSPDSLPDSLRERVVTANDVDGMRTFLEGFNGDFRTLFGPPEGHSRS